MAPSRKKALEYGERLIAHPRARLPVTLRQTKNGVTLLHNGKAVTRCYLTPSGLRAATLMARALGVKVPPLGKSVDAQVSTGIVWRAISLSALDYRKEESYPLAERLLEEAEAMRTSESVEL
ncbi:MAG: hypothetical protein FJ039_05095 [Chloroflexi bacterium]|nr:hypothetical protein [Chloroflexota bacterium]